MSDPVTVPQEIIIVRRSSGDGEGGHHGGAWKIAYADFVTAMMAFFLVMWLINSSNEVTKSKVASYFNPIKMTDAAPSGRGLSDKVSKKSAQGIEDKPIETGLKSGKDAGDKDKADAVAEARLLQHPFSVLEEIVVSESSGRSDGEKDIVSRSVGDPFDPKAWKALRNGPENGSLNKTEDAFENIPLEDAKPSESDVQDKVENRAASKKPILRPAKDLDEKATTEPDSQTVDNVTNELENTLKAIIYKHKSELDVSLSVRRTSEGLLIMLGDESGRGMFEIGSAKPSAGLIDIVGVIGKFLSQQVGGVVIRGHTDIRQYKSGRHDNWQLSTARAHMASYMLIRGGLDDSRIMRIEGHGSASPLLAKDPMADANRRVEFLLSEPLKSP
jgi:chemotaxis protein MotB